MKCTCGEDLKLLVGNVLECSATCGIIAIVRNKKVDDTFYLEYYKKEVIQ